MTLSQQGVRPGGINMGRVLRHLRFRTDQSRKVVYYRPPIYGKDNYGVENTTIVTNEILIPELSALIRPTVTENYQIQESGHNIIGAARVYTPNIQTIKNFPNFDQTVGKSNIAFNEIEGWDRFIDTSRTIYTVPTSGTSGWAEGTDADVTFASDGQTLTATLGTDYDGTFNYSTSATNTLESDRLRFDIKVSGASTIKLSAFNIYNGGTGVNDKLAYTPGSTLTIPTGSWLTVDVPFASGSISDGTTIYKAGNRFAIGMASGSSWNEEENFEKIEFQISGTASGNKVYIKDLRFYKSLSWHVHSCKEFNRDYMIFNCIRTTGARDSRRRAYG